MRSPTSRSSARVCATAGLLLVAVAPASSAAPGAQRAPASEQRGAALAGEVDAAVAQLAQLDRRLAAARAGLAAVRGRAAAHAARTARVETRLRLARHNARAAQRLVHERLRELYVAGSPAPVEIVLAARSVRDAVAALDGLELAAEEDRRLVGAADGARRRLARLRRALARETGRLRRAETSAAAEAARLSRARAERAEYLERLREEQRLSARAVASVERRARAAAAPPPAPAVAAPVVPAGRTVAVVASGYALRGPTATGVQAGWGLAAVDPAVIPLGTRMTVPGYGEAVAADVGPAITGLEIDLWFPSEREALAWGRRTVTITVHSRAGE